VDHEVRVQHVGDAPGAREQLQIGEAAG